MTGFVYQFIRVYQLKILSVGITFGGLAILRYKDRFKEAVFLAFDSPSWKDLKSFSSFNMAILSSSHHESLKAQQAINALLETMLKNYGDQVHFQIAERNILDEMIKIVRKKAHMQVRDKILVLLDSWQEAFGGPGGKYPQYYWAYEELKRTGVVFPKRSLDASPIFTPPPTHQSSGSMHAGYGMPSGSSKTLDETMATEIETLR
ncbi:hypothetical protein AHAS_Ahas03G0391000 [Arachis hypogaea]